MSICFTKTQTGQLIPTAGCGDSRPSHPLNETAPLPISLFGVLSAFVLLFLLGWVLFRRHLATLPGMSKKKIFVVIGIFALCVGSGISWHILHDLYQYIADLTPKAYASDTLILNNYILTQNLPTYGDLISICIPAILLLLAVLIGRIGKKLLSLPVQRKSKKMTLALYPLVLIGVALTFPVFIAITSTTTGGNWHSPHITQVVISALALTVSVYALGIVLFTKHLADLFKTQKKNIILVLGIAALGIGGLSAPLYHNFNMAYSPFVLYSIISSLVPLCVLIFILMRKLFGVLLRLPIKKQSTKIAYGIYPLIAFALFAVSWISMAFLRAVFGF